MRDGVDIEPLVLRESELESFFWVVAPDIPLDLSICLEALRKSACEFPKRSAAAAVLQSAVGAGRSTAFSRIADLLNRGLLVERNGRLWINETLDGSGKSL